MATKKNKYKCSLLIHFSEVDGKLVISEMLPIAQNEVDGLCDMALRVYDTIKAYNERGTL
jgi:hypothetical protein